MLLYVGRGATIEQNSENSEWVVALRVKGAAKNDRTERAPLNEKGRGRVFCLRPCKKSRGGVPVRL